MKPSLSIKQVLLITILYFLFLTYLHVFLGMSLFSLTFYIVFVLGGGIVTWLLMEVTWFSAKNKMSYGVYYGVILAVIGGFILGYVNLLTLIILILILAGIGGFIVIRNKRERERDNKISILIIR
ncbi:hypothetical protein [Methanobacterium paludis]|uniref:Uncharacterized protein n=1 Tax=Methanobacterium paludis (strain DSM 25820 / JCM 18151 / SWAN1) TaxID=868131 RepID=F6D346_METPW|nr:hypothetical protein [Methanobacterium paludis]AEG17986.1 hypothetical protein MSWAN_0962 [Methanobacterium paludis]